MTSQSCEFSHFVTVIAMELLVIEDWDCGAASPYYRPWLLQGSANCPEDIDIRIYALKSGDKRTVEEVRKRRE